MGKKKVKRVRSGAERLLKRDLLSPKYRKRVVAVKTKKLVRTKVRPSDVE